MLFGECGWRLVTAIGDWLLWLATGCGVFLRVAGHSVKELAVQRCSSSIKQGKMAAVLPRAERRLVIVQSPTAPRFGFYANFYNVSTNGMRVWQVNMDHCTMLGVTKQQSPAVRCLKSIWHIDVVQAIMLVAF